MNADLSRRSLLAAIAAIAALGPESVSAQLDRRIAQTQWTLKRVNARDTSGVTLARVFRGYFPVPGHLALDAASPPFRFVNFDREFKDDAQDGAVVIARLADGAKHDIVRWVRRAKPASRMLRYGLVIERRSHGPAAPGQPEVRSVILSDKTDFACVVGPVEPLWELMVDAWARLPKLA